MQLIQNIIINDKCCYYKVEQWRYVTIKRVFQSFHDYSQIKDNIEVLT